MEINEKLMPKTLTNRISNLKAVNLYDNAQGSTEEITLNDNIKNYTYLQIFFKGNNVSSDNTIALTSHNKINLFTGNYYEGDGKVYIQAETITLSENKIIRSFQSQVTLSSEQPIYVYGTQIYIFKVIGYK